MTEVIARAGGGQVAIEIASATGGYSEQTGVGERMAHAAADAVVNARDAVFRVAQEFAAGIDAVEDERTPSEMTVQFGVGVTATGGVKIVGLQGSATFLVTLKYDFPQSAPPATPSPGTPPQPGP